MPEVSHLLLGFYDPPFRMQTETGVQIALEDEGKLVQNLLSMLCQTNYQLLKRSNDLCYSAAYLEAHRWSCEQ